MELRLGVEIESAGLAAERASKADVRAIAAALQEIEEMAREGKSAVDEDLAFHRAIAEAARNPEFARFLQFIGRHLIPRRSVSGLPERMGGQRAYLALIQEEHRRIADAIAAGVLVTQASAGFVPSVAELVFGLMVDLARGITRSARLYHHNEIPAAHMGRELKASTLGVIGYGAIGREVARIGKALGMRVLIHDPYKKVKQVPLDKLLAQSDFVVPLAVATAETENLMDARAFAKMKQGAYFVNVSRGNLVDEQALEAALDSGRLAGCAMDVGRAPDQMPTPRLAARADVLATPHTAGLTLPAIEHQSMETVTQAAAIAKGRAPKGAVNAKHWKRKPK